MAVRMRTLPWAMVVCGIVITLAGCATPYQKSGFRGGYSDVQIDGNTFSVEFRGNGYTRRQTVETYLLYRCAQFTTEAGYDYFVIVGRDTDTKNQLFATTGNYTSNTTGNEGGQYTPIRIEVCCPRKCTAVAGTLPVAAVGIRRESYQRVGVGEGKDHVC